MLDGADKVIVALDCDREKALHIGKLLAGQAQWVKVGMTLYYAYGPSIVSEMHDMGFKGFLDLKLHDIPHQIRGAAKAASEAGADMLTLHALGGSAMIEAAREGVEAAAASRQTRTQLLSVTVLTSMDSESLQRVGISTPLTEEVRLLAQLARDAGSDGIVCSPHEVGALRKDLGSDSILVTPGIRPAGANPGDQSRIATPAQALEAGASQLVVGRPIVQAEDPLTAFQAVVSEVN